MKPTQAKFDKLNSLLSITQYTGFQEEKQNPVDFDSLPNKDILHKTVQASIAELDVYLHSKDVVEVGGRLRLLSKNAVLEAMSVLFSTIVVESWTIDSLDENLCILKMVDIDSVVLKHILKLLGSFDGQRWHLDLQKVLSASANLLFSRKFRGSSGKPVSSLYILVIINSSFSTSDVDTSAGVSTGVVTDHAGRDVQRVRHGHPRADLARNGSHGGGGDRGQYLLLPIFFGGRPISGSQGINLHGFRVDDDRLLCNSGPIYTTVRHQTSLPVGRAGTLPGGSIWGGWCIAQVTGRAVATTHTLC